MHDLQHACHSANQIEDAFWIISRAVEFLVNMHEFEVSSIYDGDPISHLRGAFQTEDSPRANVLGIIASRRYFSGQFLDNHFLGIFYLNGRRPNAQDLIMLFDSFGMCCIFEG